VRMQVQDLKVELAFADVEVTEELLLSGCGDG